MHSHRYAPIYSMNYIHNCDTRMYRSASVDSLCCWKLLLLKRLVDSLQVDTNAFKALTSVFDSHCISELQSELEPMRLLGAMLQTRPVPGSCSVRQNQRTVDHAVRHRQSCIVCRLTTPIRSDVLISTYTDSAGELMRAATFSRLVSQPDPSDTPTGLGTSTSSSRPIGQAEIIEFPQRSGNEPEPKKDTPLVRVRLSVHYRVHSRQMLCIGGSQIPFGWSFLSIAKVPMVWNQGDVWTAEVRQAANTVFAAANVHAVASQLLDLSSTQTLFPGLYHQSQAQNTQFDVPVTPFPEQYTIRLSNAEAHMMPTGGATSQYKDGV